MVLLSLVTLVGAYLVGSIPTGYLVGRARGLDLRTLGSGNIGATNALRILGKPAGTFVLLADAFKGWCGCVAVPHLAAAWINAPDQRSVPTWLSVLGGIFAVLGHNFTCWLRFKGGKGIATSAGVLLGLIPAAFATVLAVFLAGLFTTRIVSLSSLLAASVLPLATWYWHRQPLLVGFSFVLAGLAIYRHRANIARLRAGTEPRIGQRPVDPTTPASR